MQGLKILVVVMGVLIVGGTVTLVALLVQRVGGAGGQSWETSLAQPDGARIGGIAAGEGFAAVWMVRPDGDRVVLVEPRRGRVAGEIRLR